MLDFVSRDVGDNELAGATPAAHFASGTDRAFGLVCEREDCAAYRVRVGNRKHVHRVRAFGP